MRTLSIWQAGQRMTAIILDGNRLAAELLSALQAQAQRFAEDHGRAAHLALIVAGEDEGALVFGRQVMRACRQIGVATSLTEFAADVTEAAVRSRVAQASRDEATDGVVVLLPLPAG